MLNSMGEISQSFILYCGSGFLTILGIISFVYIWQTKKESHKPFLIPLILLFACIINPILYKFVFSKIIYWRLFWFFPSVVLIGYSYVQILQDHGKNIFTIPFRIAFFLVVLVFGCNVFLNGDFITIRNLEKVAPEVKDVCDCILSYAEEPRCVFPRSLYSEVRQYDGNIQMMYGRNTEGYITDISREHNRVYEAMESSTPNYSYILLMADREACDFVVTYRKHPIEDRFLEQYRYALIDTVDTYNIYRRIVE